MLQFGPVSQPCEIASVLVSMSDCHRLTELSLETCVPSKSVQMRWINSYLASYHDLNLHEISMTQIEDLYRQVSLCTLLYLLQQTTWSLLMLKNSTNEMTKKQFANITHGQVFQFGVSRFKLYKKMKYNVMALEI